MANADNPLFTAHIVSASKPDLMALDLAEYHVVEKTPQQWLREVGRQRFWSQFDSNIGVLSIIGGVGIISGGIFNWASTGSLEFLSPIGFSPVFLTGGRFLLDRGKKMEQKANAIELALNSNRQ